MDSKVNRRRIRQMAARWGEHERWDGQPTEELLVAFGATVARMVRREERDGRLTAFERRTQVEPAGIPPPPRLRAAALERKEHRR